MSKKVITNERVKNSLRTQFKEFLDTEKIHEQISKQISEHSIKKGRILEFYQYLDTALVELANGKTVEAYILHRMYGGIVDLFTPDGEQVISETKHEPCIIPRYYQNVLVAEVGDDEFVILGYYGLENNMVGSFSPANSNEYVIKMLTDTSQGGLSITPGNINFTTDDKITFTHSDIGESSSIEYADSNKTYTKEQVDNMIKEIWEYIDPTHYNQEEE